MNLPLLALSLCQLASKYAFQYAQRSAFWIFHAGDRQIERMLKRELARHGGVRDRIREAGPGRAGWNRKVRLRDLILIVFVRLHAVMNAKHVVVVRGSPALRDVQPV